MDILSKFPVVVFMLVMGMVSLCHAGPDSQSSATRYLQAWSFKDYPAMYLLSSSEVRKQISEQNFYAAAAALPAPVGDPRVVNRSSSPGAGETLYLEYTAAGSEAAVRSSIVVQADGVKHADLMSRVVSVAAPSAKTSAGIGVVPLSGGIETTPDKNVDGETAETILAKMQKAVDAAETLRADLAMRGSLMGETINETAKLLYRAPDHMRMDGNKFVMNSDGQRSILYLPQMNTYMDVGSLGSFELAPGIGTSAAELKEKYSITLVGKAEIDGVPAYQLNLKPPTDSGGIGSLMSGIGGGTMKLWISAKNWMPIRAKIDTISVDYRNMQINAGGIDDSSFTFIPPNGAQELNIGGLLGGLTSGKLPGE